MSEENTDPKTLDKIYKLVEGMPPEQFKIKFLEALKEGNPETWEGTENGTKDSYGNEVKDFIFGYLYLSL